MLPPAVDPVRPVTVTFHPESPLKHRMRGSTPARPRRLQPLTVPSPPVPSPASVIQESVTEGPETSDERYAPPIPARLLPDKSLNAPFAVSRVLKHPPKVEVTQADIVQPILGPDARWWLEPAPTRPPPSQVSHRSSYVPDSPRVLAHGNGHEISPPLY